MTRATEIILNAFKAVSATWRRADESYHQLQSTELFCEVTSADTKLGYREFIGGNGVVVLVPIGIDLPWFVDS